MPAGARGGCKAGLIRGRRTSVGARAAQLILHVYRVSLSPWLGPACRFEPSCSQYAAAAIERHGVLRGCYLALRRIARCNPLGGYGYDPVP